MSARKHIISGLLVLLLLAGSVAAQTVDVVRVDSDSQVMIAKRTTLAIMYPEDDGTEINMVGTSISPRANGKADVKRKEGRTRIKFKMNNLGHPQSLGAYYTTYILWAIAPEGQADNIAELPVRGETDIEVTTSFQTFGLIVTAEPHSAVRFPSPIIVAENALRRGTEGGIQTSRIEYSGDPGTLYVISSPDIPSINADYNTPLLILGARRAVEIARRAEATRYADAELRQAEVKLAALEQIWPRDRNDPEEWSGHAREVMRLGENARTLAVERMIAARLEMERRIASETISQAQTEADRARIDADRARIEAAEYREAMTRAEREAAMARERLDQAQTEADRAKAREELARAEAERARLEAHQARQEKDEVQQRLFVSLSEILETRREARGLIVNLSDVLFDFNKATLTPGAREKLSKLAGILLAYPGSYRLEIEGHTDSVGSHEYNMKLSQDRAESVRYYLVQSGITPDRIVAVRGFGEIRPVATNETNEGRQVNRRVELVITDLTSTPGTNNK